MVAETGGALGRADVHADRARSADRGAASFGRGRRRIRLRNAAEERSQRAIGRSDGGDRRGWREPWHDDGFTPRLRRDHRAVCTEGHGDRAVHIGSEDPRSGLGKTLERAPGRMAVGIAGSGRGDRDPWPDGRQERVRRRGPAAVVCHLEQVDVRQAFRQQ
jgi:hypothetical protein